MDRKGKYVEGFSQWLELKNYALCSLQSDPRRIRDFLAFMDSRGIKEVGGIRGKDVKGYFESLAKRKSRKTGEVLSKATLRNYLTTIRRFSRYVRLREGQVLEVPVSFKGGKEQKGAQVLTEQEIERLYASCPDGLLGLRDKAMLGVFYGLGLRRDEGADLKIGDLHFESGVVYVRKGKGQKERYVPMAKGVKNDFLQYVRIGRRMLMESKVHEVFFVGIKGNPLTGSALYERIRKLAVKAGIKKRVGLHTLRHSIATHLLYKGMPLTEIGRFLGHSSLQSTQIYTHLKNEIHVRESN